MFSWLVLILALILFSMLGMLLFSAIFGRGEALPAMEDTANVKAANREAVEEGRFDDIQLEVVHRGYRMDQVDALIAQLTGDAERDESVELPEETVLLEGEATHGSNETAHR
ncbi:cell division protein DivIVA [Corynebacterium sp. Q4381]|uniref:cell division protein DivIVA n=1 Tax=Corynebacterium sp. Marseille-Q4381 TaxID=3121597 RepID=UPI002FE517C6